MAAAVPTAMEYEVTNVDDVPVTDLSEIDEIPPDLDMQPVGSMLGSQNMSVNVWHFEEGDEIGYHAHSEQEELFYVLDGTFSLKLGRSGEEEVIEVEEGAIWVVEPMIGRGHRCVSDDGGKILAIGSPNVEDPGLDPHGLDDEEIDEAL
jgi:quercetin dioxygenase-like cupin family protein